MSTHIGLRNLWGGTLKYLYSQGKLIQYKEEIVDESTSDLTERHYIIDNREFFFHALLYPFYR